LEPCSFRIEDLLDADEASPPVPPSVPTALNEIDALVDAVEPDGRLALAFDVDFKHVSLAQPPPISSRPSMVLHASS